MRICFVCMGNICRSPTAHGVMEKLARDAGMHDRLVIDSAGTGAWHVGELPDPRSRAAAQRRGYELTHRARKFSASDFDRFDLVLAMDRDNFDALQRLARGRTRRVMDSTDAVWGPQRSTPQIVLLRSFDPGAPEGAEVPDPYSGEDDGFEEVLAICERACHGLLAHLRARVP